MSLSWLDLAATMSKLLRAGFSYPRCRWSSVRAISDCDEIRCNGCLTLPGLPLVRVSKIVLPQFLPFWKRHCWPRSWRRHNSSAGCGRRLYAAQGRFPPQRSMEASAASIRGAARTVTRLLTFWAATCSTIYQDLDIRQLDILVRSFVAT